MSVAYSDGIQVLPGAHRSRVIYTQSTATAVQTITGKFDLNNLGMGTATGFGVNRYLLATGDSTDGRELTIQATATGEAYLVFTGTATGALVFLTATDSVRLRQHNGVWFVTADSGATIATATGTA